MNYQQQKDDFWHRLLDRADYIELYEKQEQHNKESSLLFVQKAVAAYPLHIQQSNACTAVRVINNALDTYLLSTAGKGRGIARVKSGRKSDPYESNLRSLQFYSNNLKKALKLNNFEEDEARDYERATVLTNVITCMDAVPTMSVDIVSELFARAVLDYHSSEIIKEKQNAPNPQ